MKIEEIRDALEEAWHEIGHAYAFIGEANFLAAQSSVAEARKKINSVYKTLDKIQD